MSSNDINDPVCNHITIPDSYPVGSVCNCGAVKCKEDTYNRVIHLKQLGDDQMIWIGTMPLVLATRYDVHDPDGTHYFSLVHRSDKILGNPGEGLVGTVYECIEAHIPADDAV